MAIHFSEQELKQRRDFACEELQKRGLHALLCFRQESDYYLSGYDTFGYCFFQCLLLCADGRMALLTRAPDLRQAQHTSIIEDIRIWSDQAGSNPARQLVDMLDEFGCRGRQLGIEYDAYGLRASIWRQLEREIDGFCDLSDASDLVTRLRLVKSKAEIDYVIRAAELADDALDAAMPLIQPGAWEGDILAAMHAAIFAGGGDYPGNEFIIGAGADALLCRYFSGRKHLAGQDQLTLEWAGAYRHYHAAMMRTIIVGEADAEHLRMHEIAVEALLGCEQALGPGVAVGDVFDTHARIADAGGLKQHRLNACGYSLGTTFTPTWMDWPMLYHGNDLIAEPNMIFFMHMIFVNSDSQHAMTLGHTVRVTGTGCERLSRSPLDLLVVN
ncbi:MAG: Xaa-Pro peptidase family protein [Gammaproteobacteria bacterium]|nr:Xaa-Pro peptidase family protein [Gammaproteobacteria bacterium]